jgi:hypothetical protein
LETNYDIAQQLRRKALVMLGFPLRTEKIDRDGKTIHVHPAKWQMSTVAEFLRLAAEIEHAVLEAGVQPLDKYSLDELLAIQEAGYQGMQEAVEGDEREADS